MAKFKPGQSGNPRGRPKGCSNASRVLREKIHAELPAIIKTLVELAQGGDTQAASVLLARALPPLRPVSEATELSGAGATLADRAEAVAAATLAGNLAPSTASELMGMLAGHARIVETSELAARLERIEEALKLQAPQIPTARRKQ
jgi:hypothetical protein